VVELVPVTKDSWRAVCDLRVRADQEGFVSSNLESLAEAAVRPEAVPLAVVAGGELVGFAMLFDDGRSDVAGLWRFMIAADHQRRGYGAAAVRAVIEHFRAIPRVSTLRVSAVAEEGGPGPFYERLGFVATGHISGDGEAGYTLPLRDG
jgi:diamine N-acetyltransferase